MSGPDVLAIDVGGTKTLLARVQLPEGRILDRRVLTTPEPASSGAAFLDEVVAAARDLQAGAGPCRAVGLGICELVSPAGTVESGLRVRWQGLPVLARLAELAPARIGADVHVAALAEARLGAGQAYRDFLYVNVGTGISTALVLDGRPRPGARGHALVLASSPWSCRCPACGHHAETTVEALAGGEGLAQLYARRLGRAGADARAVLVAARDGDRLALAVVEEAAEVLGSALAMAAGLLDPEAIVVGGGLGSAPGPYWSALERETRQRIWSTATRLAPIHQASLAADSGVVGAALLAGAPARGP